MQTRYRNQSLQNRILLLLPMSLRELSYQNFGRGRACLGQSPNPPVVQQFPLPRRWPHWKHPLPPAVELLGRLQDPSLACGEQLVEKQCAELQAAQTLARSRRCGCLLQVAILAVQLAEQIAVGLAVTKVVQLAKREVEQPAEQLAEQLAEKQAEQLAEQLAVQLAEPQAEQLAERKEVQKAEGRRPLAQLVGSYLVARRRSQRLLGLVAELARYVTIVPSLLY